MITYSLRVNSPDYVSKAENIVKLVHDSIRLLSSDASVGSEPTGIDLIVTIKKDNSGLPKILEGLGFTPTVERMTGKSRKLPKIINDGLGVGEMINDKTIRKLHKVPLTSESGFSGVVPTKYARELVKKVAAEEQACSVPSGRYRHDGTQEYYYAHTMQLKLAAKEFGPGVRFERADGTWWVVVELTNGQYGLKPATD